MGKTSKNKTNSFQKFAPISGVKGFAIAKKAPGPAPVASHQRLAVVHTKNVHWGTHNSPIQVANLPAFMR